MDTDPPRPPERRPGLHLAADVGATFTDVAVFDPATGKVRVGKLPSAPGDAGDAIAAAAARAGAAVADAGVVVFAAPLAADTLRSRAGARTALLLTAGFRDVCEIGGSRPAPFDTLFHKPLALVERALRFEVRERVLADGSIETPLDDAEITALGHTLAGLGVEAVAIMFVNSYRNPSHEARARAVLAAGHPGMFVTASHDLSREYREFERCATVAANACAGPRVAAVLDTVGRDLGAAGFAGPLLVAQSSGGVCGAAQAARHAVRTVAAGPAAGVIAARAVCRALAIDDAIAFDMGGAAATAAVIRNGEPLMAGGTGDSIRDLPIRLAMVDTVAVGAGGAAVVAAEDGALRLARHPAPAPACWGGGGAAATLTDAQMVLGRLGGARFLGGTSPGGTPSGATPALDDEAARKAVTTAVAGPLGMELLAAADGMVRVAVAATANGVRTAATERGCDPGTAVLIAYGGAGPLHAVEIAREAAIPRVIVPTHPGVLSAVGLLHADLRYDAVLSWLVGLHDAPFDVLTRLYAEQEVAGRRALAAAPVKPDDVAVSRAIDLRHASQRRSLTVDLPVHVFADHDRDAIRRLFDAAHLQRWGTRFPDQAVEIVSLRTTVTGVLPKPVIDEITRGGAAPGKAARTGTRPVYFERHGVVDTRTFAREALVAGNRIRGPAVVEEYSATTLLAPGDVLEVDRFGNLDIAVGRRKP